jgi:hypothetical protein
MAKSSAIFDLPSEGAIKNVFLGASGDVSPASFLSSPASLASTSRSFEL